MTYGKMSSKKGKRTSGDILEQEDVLQALVIADSFNRKFLPLTAEKPRVLLPLVNIPLIDYTIEFLVSSGVQEIFVFCCSHSDQIKKHISSSRWSNSPCTMTTIVSETSTTMGDAIREMESKKGVLRSHFILINGDVVSNVRLKDIVETHRRRFQQDKSTVMTLINKRAKPGHQTRDREEEFLTVTGPQGRVLNFQRLRGRKKLKLPMHLFQEHSSMTVRHDLIDTHVCVCSPRVVELFVDNFDYKTKNDFIRGILINEEIEGNKLFLHVLEDEYAARVSSLPLYDSVSKDVINRWVFPVVPEHITVGGYSLRRHNQYVAEDVTLGRGCSLEEDVVIGSNTSIGDETTISQSVIGRGCTIGSNVRLENAYLWEGVTVEDNSVVTFSILCDDVTVKARSTIKEGCLLSFGVTVGPDISIPTRTSMTCRPLRPITDDDFNETEKSIFIEGDVPCDTSAVGAEGVGYVWVSDKGSDEEEEEDNIRGPSLGLNISRELSSLEESDSEDSDEELPPSTSEPLDDTALFYSEVLESIQRTMEENVKVDNLILEVNSSKHAYNISIKELNQLVMKAVLDMPGDMPTTQLLQAMKKLVKKLSPLFHNYFRNAESQMDCLRVIQDHCDTNSGTLAILPKFLLLLYEEDVLAEEVIIHWSQMLQKSERSQHQEVLKMVQPFVTWLQEADEESEED